MNYCLNTVIVSIVWKEKIQILKTLSAMKISYLTLCSVYLLLLLSGCYTYNIPSGANTPLITEEGEMKASFGGNFNEIGGNFSIGLTNHVVFSSSANIMLWNPRYDQAFDSVVYKKQPNNFEVAFGYHGHKNKYANLLLFGIGTGSNTYTNETNDYTYGYYQADYIQYFLQYTGGFKYDKRRRHETKHKEHGISLRYAYHDYSATGIANKDHYEEVWNDSTGMWDYIYYSESYRLEEINHFNSLTFYYFFRTGNDKIQFELSPGFTLYDQKPKYSRNYVNESIHFNVGMVFNLNSLF
jgi:hypothetical protein